MESDRWSFGEPFQIQVLGLMLRDNKFLPRYIDVLDHTYFDNQDLSNIAYLVLNRFKSQGDVPHRDTLTCLIHEYAATYDKLGAQGLENRLNHFLDHIYSRDIDEEFITSRIVKFGKRQAIRIALIECCDVLSEDKPVDEGDDFAEKVSKKVEEACKRGSGRDIGLVWHRLAHDLSGFLKTDKAYLTKVPTGLPGVDDLLSGGVGAGEMAVVMGGPNKGKSTILTAIGAAATFFLKDKAEKEGTEPKAVIHITCEMSDKAIFQKYGAAVSGVHLREVREGTGGAQERVDQALPRQGPLVIKHFVPGSTSADEIRWYIANLMMVENIVPGIIILDYADRLRGGEDDRFRGMGEIYDKLISMGHKFECPVWTGSQIRRFNYNDELIGMDSGGESSKKMEHSDIILSLNQKPLEKEQKILRINLVKVRDGESGHVVYVHFDPTTVSVRESTEEELKELERRVKASGEIPGSAPSPEAFKKRGSKKSEMPQTPPRDELVAEFDMPWEAPL